MIHSIHLLPNHGQRCRVRGKYRVQALRLLCQDPDMLIGDVAVECGFADVAYFSRVFRQYYGKTPTQARNDHQNQ